jgi:6-pyruvoyltetrahydropterin/6-carboxytetrahydropterin synthase
MIKTDFYFPFFRSQANIAICFNGIFGFMVRFVQPGATGVAPGLFLFSLRFFTPFYPFHLYLSKKLRPMPPTIHITRRERFNAAHRLFKPHFTDEENNEVFGKCSNPNWHGHNYTLYVTVKGEVNPDTGFLINLKWLSHLIREKIIRKVDHKNLNLEVDFMLNKMPTTENIAIAIWEQLEPEVKGAGAALHCVRIEETENNSAEYYG